MQLVTTVQEQGGEAREASPGAGGEAVIGEPERAVRLLTGEAGGRFPGAVGVERGIAACCKRGVEEEAVSDDDGDDADGGCGGAVAEVPDDAVTSSPSCDPWMSQGC